MKRRVLYLGIETKSRELYGKLFLAAKATERGWLVLFGPQRDIRHRLRQGPLGLYLEISIPAGKAERLARYHADGHKIVDLCEENVVYVDGWDYCRRKVSEEALSHVDLVLASGTRNEGHLRQFRPEGAGKFVITGNPRFDTLLPEARTIYRAESDAIRRRHGRFLLVNTNFGTINHYEDDPEDRIRRLLAKNEIEGEAHAEQMRAWFHYKKVHMDRLKPVLVELAAAKSFDKIVLRPHPSENHDAWRAWAAPYGIDVRFEGSANNWLLAADAILHTGCTTGIEGVLLDRPVASFVPEPGHPMLNQADEVSVPVGSAGEFLDIAAGWRSLDADGLRTWLAPQRQKILPMIANVEPPMAADRILDAFDRLDVPEGTLAQPPLNALRRLERTIHIGLREMRKSGERLQKFPGVEHAEIAAPLAAWVEAGVLRRLPGVTPAADGTWLFS
jgi:surface carbohydrate biosynthesis protein